MSSLPKNYFSYHALAHRLIAEGKLKSYYYVENHNGISPAFVLVFDDDHHPVMPIRQERWEEYLAIIPPQKETPPPNT